MVSADSMRKPIKEPTRRDLGDASALGQTDLRSRNSERGAQAGCFIKPSKKAAS